MDASDDLLLDGELPSINPYEVLGLERTATADQVKSAYRKLALKNHPDKVSEDQKQKAHETFQSIAFAYAVLSDPIRRKRYDETGSTSESVVDSDGFSWSDFYREQFRDAISDDAIEKFAAQYKGSDEERDDILIAYEEHEGNMDAIYETVMLSDVLADDERFRKIIDDAIASKDVPAFKAYTKESKKSRQARVKAAKSEATEAEDYAKELGIHDKLFGNKKGKEKEKGKNKKESSEDALAALIRRNQQGRESFLDNLAAKYSAAPATGKRGKKRRAEESEPSEEAFQAAAARDCFLQHDCLQNAMTTAEQLVYYPQYCFHLSPTITKWCPLRASDIAGLIARPGFEDAGIFFYMNHPIQWVRITGVVVAIDNYYGHRVYTIDDSTGQCIECTLATPNTTSGARPHGESKKHQVVSGAHTAQTTITDTTSTTPFPADVDVGTVLDVKGTVKLFRGQKQISIRKATRVLSTNEEVLFWDKIRDFRRDILSQPWVLQDREVRMWRLRQVEAAEPKAKKRRNMTRALAEGLATDPTESKRNEAESIHVSKDRPRPKSSVSSTSAKAARAQRTARIGDLRSKASNGDKYSALGL
ncbi:hypothetical protein F5Y10DRAFT_281552 [Nemania abortiva]|nr:hypothetical protein F5Y10DRAFT_281552 [Nemania abortiva]